MGKVVIVTGGASGTGASIVEHLAAQNAHVAFLEIDAVAAKRLADADATRGGVVHLVLCDIRDIAALRRAVEKIRATLGPITALVNNAVRDDRHQIEDVTPTYWDERMAVNLRHQFFAAQAVLPDMRVAGGGAFVDLGSTSWRSRPPPSRRT